MDTVILVILAANIAMEFVTIAQNVNKVSFSTSTTHINFIVNTVISTTPAAGSVHMSISASNAIHNTH